MCHWVLFYRSAAHFFRKPNFWKKCLFFSESFFVKKTFFNSKVISCSRYTFRPFLDVIQIVPGYVDGKSSIWSIFHEDILVQYLCSSGKRLIFPSFHFLQLEILYFREVNFWCAAFGTLLILQPSPRVIAVSFFLFCPTFLHRFCDIYCNFFRKPLILIGFDSTTQHSTEFF